MDSVIGAEGSLVVRFVVAFVIVLALIGVTFWLIRRFGTARVGAAAQRGRAPRLAVIDATPVDGRRRLVLVRRDNVEHLLMIGGPSDIVVEQNIVRAVPVNAPRDVPVPRAQGATEGAIPRAAAEAARAPAFEEDASWPPAQPEPPVRAPVGRPDLTVRPPRPLEPRPLELRPLEPRPLEPRPFAEPMVRPAPAGLAPRPVEPVPTPIVPAAEHAEAPAAPDAALASMAQRLEAALRRPGAPEPRPAPQPAERGEPTLELPASEPPPTAPDFTPPRSEPKAAKPKTVLDSLEEEMASLLGRPPEKQ